MKANNPNVWHRERTLVKAQWTRKCYQRFSLSITGQTENIKVRQNCAVKVMQNHTRSIIWQLVQHAHSTYRSKSSYYMLVNDRKIKQKKKRREDKLKC